MPRISENDLDLLYPVIKTDLDTFLRSIDGINFQFSKEYTPSGNDVKFGITSLTSPNYQTDEELCDALWETFSRYLLNENDNSLFNPKKIFSRYFLNQDMLLKLQYFFNSNNYLIRFKFDRAVVFAEMQIKFLCERLQNYPNIPKKLQVEWIILENRILRLKSNKPSEATLAETYAIITQLTLIKNQLPERIKQALLLEKPEDAKKETKGRETMSFLVERSDTEEKKSAPVIKKTFCCLFPIIAGKKTKKRDLNTVEKDSKKSSGLERRSPFLR